MSDDMQRVFTGSFPDFYDRYLVPMMFAPYARILAQRAKTVPFDKMVLAQGLGDEDRQAARYEEGDRRSGATVSRDHAPPLG